MQTGPFHCLRALRSTLLVACVTSSLLGCQGVESEAPEAFDASQVEAQRSDPLYVASRSLWGYTIPVCWENPAAGTGTTRGWVQDAISETWEMATRVDFTGWGTCPTSFNGIRIRISDEGPHTKGLGTALKGKAAGMVLNFTFNNWGDSCQDKLEYCIRTMAVHEFGHALGFAHEQNRSDTPDWCGEEPQGNNGDVTVGAWDSDSVMNYCNPVWTGDGKLSNGDIRGAQRYYGARTSHALAGDFNGDGRSDAFIYAPGSGRAWVSMTDWNGNLAPSCGGQGFYGYDFWDFNDQALVLDYDGNGWDDLFFYRAGGAVAYVMRSNGNGSFSSVYASGAGIGGFDMWDSRDRAVRLDFNGDNLDDLLMYRQGTGVVHLARSNGNGSFTNVYASSWGIGGYAMNGSNDQVLVFDYDGDNREDLFLYRPGHAVAYVARSNGDGSFTNVYASTGGIAGFDLYSLSDRVVVFDYNGDNRDDLMLYRPGGAVVYVARSNGNGSFTNVYASHNGLAGFDMWDSRDHATAFDYNSDGRDDLFLYRAGGNVAHVARSNGDGSFTNVYASYNGVGGFDLKNESDRAISLDANAGGGRNVLMFREDKQTGMVAFSNGTGGLSTGTCMNACDTACSL